MLCQECRANPRPFSIFVLIKQGCYPHTFFYEEVNPKGFFFTENIRCQNRKYMSMYILIILCHIEHLPKVLCVELPSSITYT